MALAGSESAVIAAVALLGTTSVAICSGANLRAVHGSAPSSSSTSAAAKASGSRTRWMCSPCSCWARAKRAADPITSLPGNVFEAFLHLPSVDESFCPPITAWVEYSENGGDFRRQWAVYKDGVLLLTVSDDSYESMPYLAVGDRRGVTAKGNMVSLEAGSDKKHVDLKFDTAKEAQVWKAKLQEDAQMDFSERIAVFQHELAIRDHTIGDLNEKVEDSEGLMSKRRQTHSADLDQLKARLEGTLESARENEKSVDSLSKLQREMIDAASPVEARQQVEDSEGLMSKRRQTHSDDPDRLSVQLGGVRESARENEKSVESPSKLRQEPLQDVLPRFHQMSHNLEMTLRMAEDLESKCRLTNMHADEMIVAACRVESAVPAEFFAPASCSPTMSPAPTFVSPVTYAALPVPQNLAALDRASLASPRSASREPDASNFVVGQSCMVWSATQSRWYEDGKISDVIPGQGIAVRYNTDKTQKLLPFKEIFEHVRMRAEGPDVDAPMADDFHEQLRQEVQEHKRLAEEAHHRSEEALMQASRDKEEYERTLAHATLSHQQLLAQAQQIHVEKDALLCQERLHFQRQLDESDRVVESLRAAPTPVADQCSSEERVSELQSQLEIQTRRIWDFELATAATSQAERETQAVQQSLEEQIAHLEAEKRELSSNLLFARRAEEYRSEADERSASLEAELSAAKVAARDAEFRLREAEDLAREERTLAARQKQSLESQLASVEAQRGNSSSHSSSEFDSIKQQLAWFQAQLEQSQEDLALSRATTSRLEQTEQNQSQDSDRMCQLIARVQELEGQHSEAKQRAKQAQLQVSQSEQRANDAEFAFHSMQSERNTLQAEFQEKVQQQRPIGIKTQEDVVAKVTREKNELQEELFRAKKEVSEANERLEKLQQLTSAEGNLSASIRRQSSGSSLQRFGQPVVVITAPVVSTAPPPPETLSSPMSQHSLELPGGIRSLSASMSAQQPLAQPTQLQAAARQLASGRLSSDGAASSSRGVVRNASGPYGVSSTATTRPVRESGSGTATTGRAVYGSGTQPPASVRFAPSASTRTGSPPGSGTFAPGSVAGARSGTAVAATGPRTAPTTLAPKALVRSPQPPSQSTRANNLVPLSSRMGGRTGAF